MRGEEEKVGSWRADARMQEKELTKMAPLLTPWTTRLARVVGREGWRGR